MDNNSKKELLNTLDVALDDFAEIMNERISHAKVDSDVGFLCDDIAHNVFETFQVFRDVIEKLISE